MVIDLDKRTERSEKKKKKILSHAISLFNEKDIKKVTIDDIAAQANVSKMTIYKYFGDRENLYYFIAKTLLERYNARLSEIQNSKGTVSEKMISCALILSEMIAQGHTLLLSSLGKLNEEVKQQMVNFNENQKKLIFILIAEGKASGILKHEISDECIYYYVDMGLNYFLNNLEYRKKILENKTFRKNFMHFLWSNIFMNHRYFE